MSTSPLGRNRVQIREGIQSIHTRHESGLRKPAAARSSSSHVWISYGGVCHQAINNQAASRFLRREANPSPPSAPMSSIPAGGSGTGVTEFT